MSARFTHGLCFLLGLALAAFKMGTSFFPYGEVMDVAAFGCVAVAVASFGPDRAWRWLPWLAAPAIVMAGAVLVRIGPDELRQGIGVHWIRTLALVPFATIAGGSAGAWIRGRRGRSDSRD